MVLLKDMFFLFYFYQIFYQCFSKCSYALRYKGICKGDKRTVKRKLKQVILISLVIGVPLTLILMYKPYFFLRIIYKTAHGADYLRFIAPFFIILYIQAPFASVMQAMDKSKKLCTIT